MGVTLLQDRDPKKFSFRIIASLSTDCGCPLSPSQVTVPCRLLCN